MKSKTLFAALAAVLSITTLTAHARTPMLPRQRAELTRFKLDPQLPGRDQIRRAAIELDYSTGTATLSLVRLTNPCPPQARCLVGPIYKEQKIELPIVSNAKDECGSLVITARRDLRPVDGALLQLDIRDNRSNRCNDQNALSGTQVLYRAKGYDRRQGLETSTRSTFDGDILRPTFARAE